MMNDDQLLMKDGEIKVLRARQTQLEREKLTCQLNWIRVEAEYKTQLDSVKRENEEQISKVKSELQFLEKEKTDLERRLNYEKKQREIFESQLEVLSNNVDSSQRLAMPEVSQCPRRKPQRRTINGPTFPSRSSFYGAFTTQPIDTQVIDNNGWDTAMDTVSDFDTPAPKRHCVECTSDAATMTETMMVNRGIQADAEQQPIEEVPKVNVRVEWMQLTSRLQESRPYSKGDPRCNEPKLGDMLNNKLALSLDDDMN